MRPADWQGRLGTYIERHRALPFLWGRHDCATFARGWVEMMRPGLDFSGVDAARLDEASARAALKERSFIARLEAWGVLERIAPPFAQRGDLLIIAAGGFDLLAIHAGPVAVAPGRHCLAVWPDPHLAVAAWKV